MIELAKGVQEIVLEVRSSEIAIESVSSVLDEVSKSFSVLFNTFLVSISEASSYNDFSSILILVKRNSL